jgi:hypothetical protein
MLINLINKNVLLISFYQDTKAATMIKAPRGAFIFLGIFLILAAGGLIVALTVYFTSKPS